MHAKIWWVKLKERDLFGRFVIACGIILDYILKKWGGNLWTGLI